jgi:hypothetical protein
MVGGWPVSRGAPHGASWAEGPATTVAPSSPGRATRGEPVRDIGPAAAALVLRGCGARASRGAECGRTSLGRLIGRTAG